MSIVNTVLHDGHVISVLPVKLQSFHFNIADSKPYSAYRVYQSFIKKL